MRRMPAGPNQLTLWTRAEIGQRPAADTRAQHSAWTVTIAEHIRAASEGVTEPSRNKVAGQAA